MDMFSMFRNAAGGISLSRAQAGCAGFPRGNRDSDLSGG